MVSDVDGHDEEFKNGQSTAFCRLAKNNLQRIELSHYLRCYCGMESETCSTG